MKVIFQVIAISLFMFSSCNSDKTSAPESQSNTINKIMPLGASRVEGYRPYFESYRYELWKDLIENDWNFDFIGTRSDDASYPAFKNRSFDSDHEGRGGWTSGEILNGLNDWLEQTGNPDIVLFSSPGGNDALTNLPYQQTLTNINGIIDTLQSANPNITIIIEQLAPGRSELMTPEVVDYFEQLQLDVLSIAAEQSTSTSQVIAVDMRTGFTNNMLADTVHYNEAGADFIASRYYSVLVDVME